MASRFWVGGTGTWDSTSTTHWSTSDGGTAGASAPANGDDIYFTGSSGGGTVSVSGTISGLSLLSIDATDFTGTINFASGNPNLTITGQFKCSGSATKTISLGSGTFSLTAASGTPWDFFSASNLTLNAGTSTVQFNATTPSGNRVFNSGGKTYNNLVFSAGSSSKYLIDFNPFGPDFSCANLTFTNLQNVILFGNTITISGTLTYAGASSSAPSVLTGFNPSTLSVGGSSTLSNLVIQNITKAGAGSITANNSYNAGGNTGLTVNNPSSPSYVIGS